MRKTFRACLLMLALACPTLAGEIHNPKAGEIPTPVTRSSNTATQQIKEDEIPTPNMADKATTKIVLKLLLKACCWYSNSHAKYVDYLSCLKPAHGGLVVVCLMRASGVLKGLMR